MKTFFRILITLPILGSLAGCLAETGDEEDTDDVTEALEPPAAKVAFDEAQICDVRLSDKAAFRDVDLEQGVLRWKCGDVPGVTIPHLGQEYCEYHAVSGGNVVDRNADLKKLPAGAKVSCVFTSVFSDVKGWKSPANETFEARLADELARPANLGVRAKSTDFARMQSGVNGRAAASILVDDCQDHAKKPQFNLKASRATACYRAAKARGANGALDPRLVKLCRGVDLSNAKAWARVVRAGVSLARQGEADYETERDIASCTRAVFLGDKAVPWRNSDPSICGRIGRAVEECDASFPDDDKQGNGAVPSAALGFTLTGWANRRLPVGCRHAKVDLDGNGTTEPFRHLVICDVNADVVDKARTSLAPLDPQDAFCNELFGRDIAVQAPIRAIASDQGSANTPFCKKFRGAR